MRYVLAIDQGTTGSRAIVYDFRAREVARSYREFRQYFPKPGWVEHDPEEIWSSVRLCIQDVSSRVGARSIAAIGITNQRETTVVWDRNTGRPICRAIVWQCRRTTERCLNLKKDPREVAFITQATGLPIDAYFSATKIEWILKNIPGAAALAKAGRLLFGTTDSWVLWKLTGGRTHATDFTNASRTMLYNINTLDWEERLLKKFGVPRGMLPRVQKSSGIFGYTQALGALAAGIPISGIAGDQQAALFGQACFEPGTMKNTYGTGSFILLNTGSRRVVSRCALITTLACDAQGAPVYALEGAVFIAGAAIQWLRDGLKIIKKAVDSQSLAKTLTDNGGVYFVPAFVGMGAPYWDQAARGLISGITRGTSRAHLARAALEAVCYQTKDVVAAMEKDCAFKVRDLKVDGGACANDFLMQFQADILGIRVVRPKTIETTALGAAYLAGLGAGFWQHSRQIARCWKKERVFRPMMDRKKAHGYYLGWCDALDRAFSKKT